MKEKFCWAYEHITDHDFFSKRFVKIIDVFYQCKECQSVRFNVPEDTNNFVWKCAFCGSDFDTRKAYKFWEV